MTIKSWPGSLAMTEIQAEFGGGNPLALSNYYSGGPLVRGGAIGYPYGSATGIPGGGQISIANFFGATRSFMLEIYGSTWWTVPYGVTRARMLLVGGGGGGGGQAYIIQPGGPNAFEGGGGGGGGGFIHTDVDLTPGESIFIEIGAGGLGGSQLLGRNQGGDGGASLFKGYRAVGGGGGGGVWPDGRYGGSGGGGTGTNGAGVGGPPEPGQGNGGAAGWQGMTSGGGGGAGAPANLGFGGSGRIINVGGKDFAFGGGGSGVGSRLGAFYCGPGAYGGGSTQANGGANQGGGGGGSLSIFGAFGGNGGNGFCIIYVG